MAEGGGGGKPPDRGEISGTSQMDVGNMRPAYLYTNNDAAPYRVYVEKHDATTKINKFSFGSTIRNVETYSRSITEMKNLGHNKIIVFFNRFTAANQMVEDKELQEKGYNVYVPRHLVCISGVLAGIPSDISEEEILSEIESSVPVVSVYRLTRYENNIRVPSNRVSVTFRTSTLPDRIKLLCTSCRVYPFKKKLELCMKCHRYNHKTANCKGRLRCEKCSQIHDPDDENFRSCKNDIKCFYCKTNTHRTSDQNCPERNRQASIKEMMARKCITYIEARELIAPVVVNNYYDTLANISEFPSLNESYAKMAGGRYAKKSLYTPEVRADTGLKRATSAQAVELLKTVEKMNQKRKRVEQSSNLAMINVGSEEELPHGSALHNTERVTEKERWQSLLEESARKAEETGRKNTKAEMKAGFMSFYSGLIEQPEMTDGLRSKFKEFAKKFLKFDDIIV